MASSLAALILLSLSLTRACEIFVGMTCTCYESIDLRCTMSKMAPLVLRTPLSRQHFQSMDFKFQSDDHIQLSADFFAVLNQLLVNNTQRSASASITLRFQNFYSFHAPAATFARLFQGIQASYARLTIELHPLKTKSIRFDPNAFDQLHVNELSIYADSLSSSFEAIFNNTNITHLNIEGAIVTHDPLLRATFTGHIQSLKITRMIDTVDSDEFPPFPVQSYTIEAHKMRNLDAWSFRNYSQLTGLNIIQPDVSLTSKVFTGLENLVSLQSISLDAERIANGALKHAKHIQTLVLGSYLKIIDSESLDALQALQQLDVRYVQFSTLQANTSCLLADYIQRRRLLGLTVYLPQENPDCDCILLFLNTIIAHGDQLHKCSAVLSDRCLFSSCSIVSDHFKQKQKETEPSTASPVTVNTPSIGPPLVELDDQDSQFYPDSKEDEESTTIKVPMDVNVYDDPAEPSTTTTTEATTSTTTKATEILGPLNLDSFVNEFSTPFMKRVHAEGKLSGSANYLIVSWIPFAIIASCLFLSLIVAMISYAVYHKRRTVSFKLVPQTASII